MTRQTTITCIELTEKHSNFQTKRNSNCVNRMLYEYILRTFQILLQNILGLLALLLDCSKDCSENSTTHRIGRFTIIFYGTTRFVHSFTVFISHQTLFPPLIHLCLTLTLTSKYE